MLYSSLLPSRSVSRFTCTAVTAIMSLAVALLGGCSGSEKPTPKSQVSDAPAEAGTRLPCALALEFSSLPSSQGWAYTTNGSAQESAVFSTDGSYLRQDSTAIGQVYAHYTSNDRVDPTRPFVVHVRARILQSAADTGWPSGFGFGVNGGGSSFQVWIGNSQIWDSTLQPLDVPLDSEFHTFRLEGSLAPNAHYSLLVDGTLVGEGSPVGDSGNYLWLGDGSSHGDAQVDVAEYCYSQ